VIMACICGLQGICLNLKNYSFDDEILEQ
jgi:hypothetical protein